MQMQGQKCGFQPPTKYSNIVNAAAVETTAKQSERGRIERWINRMLAIATAMNGELIESA